MRARIILPLAAMACLLQAACRTAPPELGSTHGTQRASIRADSVGGDAVLRKRAEAHALFAEGVILELNEEVDRALEKYTKAALLDSGDETLVMDVTTRLLQLNQIDKASEILREAAKNPNASGPVYARLGAIHAQAGRMEPAIAANREAVKRSPTHLAGYQNLFAIHLHAGHPDRASDVLKRAAAQKEVAADFLVSLAELYATLGRHVPTQADSAKARALDVLRRAEKLEPDVPALRLKLADGLNLLGDTNRAETIYLELIAEFEEFPVLRNNIRGKLAEIYIRSDRREEAMGQLEAVVREDPTNAQALFHLGNMAYAAREFGEAAGYFSKALVVNPALEQAYYDLASVELNRGKPDAALEVLEEARSRFPASFPMEFLSGMAESRRERYEQATAHFTNAEVIAGASDPKRLQEYFYFQAGAANERAGNHGQAAAYFEKCIALAPDFADALNYLGYMWADLGINLGRARELIEKAVRLEPDNAAFLDSLGWVHFKLNEPLEGRKFILRAIELSEEPDATVHDHLGDIEAALGQWERAREAWTKSVEIEPNETVRRKLEAAPLE